MLVTPASLRAGVWRRGTSVTRMVNEKATRTSAPPEGEYQHAQKETCRSQADPRPHWPAADRPAVGPRPGPRVLGRRQEPAALMRGRARNWSFAERKDWYRIRFEDLIPGTETHRQGGILPTTTSSASSCPDSIGTGSTAAGRPGSSRFWHGPMPTTPGKGPGQPGSGEIPEPLRWAGIDESLKAAVTACPAGPLWRNC